MKKRNKKYIRLKRLNKIIKRNSTFLTGLCDLNSPSVWVKKVKR